MERDKQVTKKDLAKLATKKGLNNLDKKVDNLAIATKQDINNLDKKVDNLAIATKQDINNLDKKIDVKIDNLELSIQKDFQRLSEIYVTKDDLKSSIQEVTYNLMDYMDRKFAVMQAENRKFQKDNNTKFQMIYKYLNISF